MARYDELVNAWFSSSDRQRKYRDQCARVNIALGNAILRYLGVPENATVDVGEKKVSVLDFLPAKISDRESQQTQSPFLALSFRDDGYGEMSIKLTFARPRTMPVYPLAVKTAVKIINGMANVECLGFEVQFSWPPANPQADLPELNALAGKICEKIQDGFEHDFERFIEGKNLPS